MKKNYSILLLALCFFLPTFGQERAAKFDPNADYQFQAVSSDGEIYAIKFEKDKKVVKETMLIDLKKNQSRLTTYDENGEPTETYEKEKLYVYDNYEGVTRMVSSVEYENKKLSDDAAFLKSQGINLGFMDQFVVDNSSWLSKVAATQKYVDWIMENVATYETALACGYTVLGNPLTAIPCATGLINYIGSKLNETNPELSEQLGMISDNVSFMKDYVSGDLPIDKWDVVQGVIDKTGDYYNERKATLHELAEQIKADIKENHRLLSEQSLEEEGDLDFSALKNSGIIQTAINKIDSIETDAEKKRKELEEKFSDENAKPTKEDIEKYTSLSDKKLAEPILQIKQNAEKQFNDSLNGTKKIYSWKKKDADGHYAIKKVYFTGIRWGKYDKKPYAKFELYFSTTPKLARYVNFGVLKTNKLYMYVLQFHWNDGESGKDIKGMFSVHKDMRAKGELDFAMRWYDFLATPVLVFDFADYKYDYSIPEEDQ